MEKTTLGAVLGAPLTCIARARRTQLVPAWVATAGYERVQVGLTTNLVGDAMAQVRGANDAITNFID